MHLNQELNVNYILKQLDGIDSPAQLDGRGEN